MCNRSTAINCNSIAAEPQINRLHGLASSVTPALIAEFVRREPTAGIVCWSMKSNNLTTPLDIGTGGESTAVRGTSVLRRRNPDASLCAVILAKPNEEIEVFVFVACALREGRSIVRRRRRRADALRFEAFNAVGIELGGA